MGWRIGVDIGGAFTDLYALNEETGEFKWVKVESTPPDYSKGVLDALRKSGIKLTEAGQIVHGQTVVINTIIERSGAKVGLVTTKGFRDVIEIQRANRRDMFNLRYRKPEPLVPRYLRLEVEERVMYDGTILKPLNEEEARQVVRRLFEEGVESFVVAFINSYANPSHEKKMRGIIEDVGRELNRERVFITLSSEITREWREYERHSTAVLNAYVLPKTYNYLTQLENAFERMGFKGPFYVMLSNAGVAVSSYVKRYPIKAIEGGPIAGVVGGVALASLIGERNVIVLDGGSTTTKASLVKDLTPRITTDYFVERDRFRPGYPVKVPTVEVVEVGNGGTSIAWIDEVGNLRVGPEAAGSYPGPACYGRGGDEPTLTDAYVVVGYLNQRALLGGELPISLDLAKKALSKIASFYDITVEEAAHAVIRIANFQAAQAIRLVSVQRGYDPREFALIAHGGSGPMFAPFIAEDLNIPKIVIPAVPAGVFNAWGMLTADLRHDVVYTEIVKLDGDAKVAKKINEIYRRLEDDIVRQYKSEGIDPSAVVLARFADARYYGQEHTIKVSVPGGEIGEREVSEIVRRFHERHRREYGFTLESNPVELVNFHVVGLVRTKKPTLPPPLEATSLDKALLEEREVYYGGGRGFLSTPVYEKTLFPLETKVEGPLIIEEKTSTIIVPHGFAAYRDRYGNVIVVKVGTGSTSSPVS